MNDGGPLLVLHVEDSRAQAKYIEQTLGGLSSGARYQVVWADSLGAALDRLDNGGADLVLLDLVLPDSQGLDTFTAIRTAYPEIPIIVLSGTGDEAVALRAVAGGAQDYLTKSSMSPDTLRRAIDYAIERHRTLQGLRQVALIDELTGVHNRRGFLLLADQHLGVARRTGSPMTVLFVDVDGLKSINDTHGHREGDRALADVAHLMRETFRASDVVGRVGGDEFCALLVTDVGEPEIAVGRLCAAIGAHNASGARPFSLSCSVGAISHECRQDTLVADLLSGADRAMYDRRAATRRPVVLIVEDDPGSLLFYEALLKDEFEIATADSGTNAMERAQRDRPSVVVLDLGLPDVDGAEVLTELRDGEDTRSIPVVVVTAADDPVTKLAGFRAGTDAFIGKPVQPDDLRQAVRNAVERAVRRR